MEKIPFYATRLLNGFWYEKQKVTKDVTLDALYNRYVEEHRFDAIRCDRAQQEKEGWQSHIFWDYDAAKWIESLAFQLERERDPDLEDKADALIDALCDSQLPDGYYNCYYIPYKLNERFTHRDDHELFCLGHFIEAAVAYFHATRKDKLLNFVKRYVDLVIKVFVEEKASGFLTPGHEEIELALVKLYRVTGEKKYLELSEFFLNNRGCNSMDTPLPWGTPYQRQDHLPVRQQKTAEGHSVRAMYLYSAMADIALENHDQELFSACDAIFRNIAEKRMYITGGVGSSHLGEAFTVDYDLKNETAYTETCATIGLAFFCQRMSAIRADSRYADIAEIAIYNGSISGISIQGDAFFYENPLTIDLSDHNKNISVTENERYPITQRQKMFGCCCCPPNILRFINSIMDFLYTHDDDTLYVHHFMNSVTEFQGVTIRQTTDYPNSGRLLIEVSGLYITIAVRVPGWCDHFETSYAYTIRDGYAYFENTSTVELDFNIRPRLLASSPFIHDNAGRVALTYGPVVYCLEGIDNPGDIFSLAVDLDTSFEVKPDPFFLLPSITANGWRKMDRGTLYFDIHREQWEPQKLRFIPYYGMENRGETDMQVWIHAKTK